MYFFRHVVHAKVEEVRFAAAASDEGRDGRAPLVYVSTEPEEQPPEVQACLALR